MYDDGSIIAQVPIPVQQDWDQDDLENAIHKVEHKLYPEVVKMLSEGRVTVRPDGKVAIDGKRPEIAPVASDGTCYVRHGIRVSKGYAW